MPSNVPRYSNRNAAGGKNRTLTFSVLSRRDLSLTSYDSMSAGPILIRDIPSPSFPDRPRAHCILPILPDGLSPVSIHRCLTSNATLLGGQGPFTTVWVSPISAQSVSTNNSRHLRLRLHCPLWIACDMKQSESYAACMMPRSFLPLLSTPFVLEKPDMSCSLTVRASSSAVPFSQPERRSAMSTLSHLSPPSRLAGYKPRLTGMAATKPLLLDLLL